MEPTLLINKGDAISGATVGAALLFFMMIFRKTKTYCRGWGYTFNRRGVDALPPRSGTRTVASSSREWRSLQRRRLMSRRIVLANGAENAGTRVE